MEPLRLEEEGSLVFLHSKKLTQEEYAHLDLLIKAYKRKHTTRFRSAKKFFTDKILDELNGENHNYERHFKEIIFRLKRELFMKKDNVFLGPLTSEEVEELTRIIQNEAASICTRAGRIRA